MTLLPAEYARHLDNARTAYLTHFREVIEAAKQSSPKSVVIEAAVSIEDDDAPAENRLDVVVETDDGFERHFVMAPSTQDLERTEHPLPGGAKLLADEVVWFAVTLYVTPMLPDLAPVNAWFRKWFDEGGKVEAPFSGHVHFIDIEVMEDNDHRIDVDFGSAPLAALEELVQICLDGGAKNIWIFSGTDALEAKVPEDAGTMLELPDELLDYLAEVREDYLNRYIERLREAQGRVALEVGAGQRQGEVALRVDFLEVDDAGNQTPQEVLVTGAVPWEDGAYELPDLELRVLRLVWSGVLLMAQPAPEDLSFLTEWFRRWLEDGFDVGEPFGGFVHMMSPPHQVEDSFSVLIDLGTAPVEALRDLIERCVDHGATSITIGSGELALSGQAPT